MMDLTNVSSIALYTAFIIYLLPYFLAQQLEINGRQILRKQV